MSDSKDILTLAEFKETMSMVLSIMEILEKRLNQHFEMIKCLTQTIDAQIATIDMLAKGAPHYGSTREGTGT